MAKRLFFVLGVCTGFLLAEIFRRQKVEKLQKAADELADIEAVAREGTRQMEQYYAQKSTEEKINLALRRAESRWDEDLEEDDSDGNEA